MKSLDNISAKMRFHLLIILIAVFSLLSGITFIHTINSISDYRDFEKKVETELSMIHDIDHSLQEILRSKNDTLFKFNEKIKLLIESIQILKSNTNNLATNILFEEDSIFREEINHISIVTANLIIYVENELQEDSSFFNSNSVFEIHKKYFDPLLESRTNIKTHIYNVGFEVQRKYAVNLFIILLMSLLVIILSIIIYTVNINANLNRILSFVEILEKGGKPKKLSLFAGLEFQNIANLLNKFIDQQEEKIQYLKTIGKGEGPEQYSPKNTDLLGNEIKIMAGRLKLVQNEENHRQKEEQKRVWTSDGIAQFSEILRSERENVQELSFKIIQKLVTYLKVEMGTLFLSSDDKDNYLNTIAAYAYDRRKYINKSFKFGEGLPGTCALEKENIYIDDVPEDYCDVISGVGQAKPKFLLFVPLKIENEIFGILELGSFRKFLDHELEFIDQIAESIASTLQGVKTNERTAILLKQSQQQAEKLIQQEEKMTSNLKELERAQEKSRKTELERSGMLNAMNKSSLVAEFNLNGKYTEINEKFLELLGSPKDQIIGKHHNEFAVIDRYSDEYKEFWLALSNGKIISKEEKFRLYSGKEIWLQQTYTPIKNDDNKIYKVLNIAIDISTEKQLQKQIDKQDSEIKRKTLEMKSLNEAVDCSIIKCELDNEGVIIDVNSNYELVTGYSRRELLGRTYVKFLRGDEKEQFDKIWLELLKEKKYEGVIRRTKPTGEEVWLMSTFSPVKDEESSIFKIYLLSLDITEKKLKYQLLEDANKEIERLREILKAYE